MLKFVTSHHHLLRTRYCYSTVANNKFRVLFFGQDKFATTQLKALVNEQENDSCIKSIDVVYPPDVKINENQVVEKKSSDLKALVESKNLKILRTPPNVNDLDNWEIPSYDVGISVYSFEYPIPSSITNRFKHGTLNVHPSLLPAYRGPSPIEHTIMHGDHQTGVTIETNKHDILAQKSVDLSQSPPVYSDLEQHLAELGSQLLIDTLRQLPNVKPFKSDGTPSEAPKVHKEWAEMDFPNMSAWQAEQLSRAFKYPLTTVYGTQSKEHKDIVVHLLGLYLPKEGPGSVGGGAPGAFVYDDKSQALHIVFGDDSVVACDRIKVDDEQVMSAKEFANKFHTEGKFGTSLGVDDSVVEDNMKRRESMKPYKQ